MHGAHGNPTGPADVGPVPVPQRRWGHRWRKRETLVAYLFVAPWLIGMSAFYIGPMVASFVYSLTDYPIIATPRWVGLANYRQMFDDDQFRKALEVTTVYMAGSVLLYVGGALCLALLCNRRLAGVGLLRTLIFLPSLVPLFSMAILWGWFFNKDFGIVNYVFAQLGVPVRSKPRNEAPAVLAQIAIEPGLGFW